MKNKKKYRLTKKNTENVLNFPLLDADQKDQTVTKLLYYRLLSKKLQMRPNYN